MILEGDCLEVMPTLEAESVDAVVTDPPYGIGFMGKEWDGPAIARAARHDAETRKSLGPHSDSRPGRTTARSSSAFGSAAHYAGPVRGGHEWQDWCYLWATEAFRLAKPSAYLLAFGGTRTVHRMARAIEDAGWLIRDMLVWAYASGFPKSKASLKPAWEPIVMARKPGPLRELAIDACRIGTGGDKGVWPITARTDGRGSMAGPLAATETDNVSGRWPANVILTDPIFDGGWDGVVGGGETASGLGTRRSPTDDSYSGGWAGAEHVDATYGDSGTYSRFFLIPKADRAEREPIWSDLPERVVSVWGGDEDDLTPGKKSTIARRNVHPTVKPLELMRHLVRLVTPTGGLVLDPFLGSGTTGIAAEMEGFRWIGIEREPEYVKIAEARLHGTQKGLGLPA